MSVGEEQDLADSEAGVGWRGHRAVRKMVAGRNIPAGGGLGVQGGP